MHVQCLRRLRHVHGPQGTGSIPEECLLPRRHEPGAAQHGALPLPQGKQHVLRLHQLLRQILFDLRIIRLAVQILIIPVQMQHGGRTPVVIADELPLLLHHEHIRVHHGGRLRRAELPPRPGIQLPDALLGLAHLLLRDMQGLCDLVIAIPGQRLQMVQYDLGGGAVISDALQLQVQALAQIRSPHPRRLQRLQPCDAAAQLLLRHTGSDSQLLRRCGEIPAVLQTAHQIVKQLPLPLRHLQSGDLAAQKTLQRLRQTSVGADTVHGGVLFLLIGPLIVAVLSVVILQPAPAVQPALGLPGQRLLLVGQLQLHRGVLLCHGLQILPHLQPPHLQQPQTMQLPHGQLLFLPQLQFHCASLPDFPARDFFVIILS